MRIAIDIRSLIEPFPSGISEYTKQITRALLEADSQNEYHLFINLASKVPDSVKLLASQDNVYLREWHYPNKLFNAALFLAQQPKLDRLIGGQVDLFFLPNINFVAISSGCPMVLTIHDISFRYNSFYSARGKFWHRVVVPQRLIQQASKIITVSASTKQDVLNHYDVPAERIQVIHHGVDHDRFNNIDETKSDAALNKYGIVGKYVLYFGTVESRKNISGLIEAWQIVQKKYNTDHQLVIAGRIGDQSLARRWPSVRFIGYVDEDAKPHIFQKATVLVYPSYFEGFGLPVLEAMATGLPVIASFSTSLAEIASDAALLVDPYNSEELALAIANVLNDVTLREKMITKGKDYSKKFTWANTAKQTLNLFKSLE